VEDAVWLGGAVVSGDVDLLDPCPLPSNLPSSSSIASNRSSRSYCLSSIHPNPSFTLPKNILQVATRTFVSFISTIPRSSLADRSSKSYIRFPTLSSNSMSRVATRSSNSSTRFATRSSNSMSRAARSSSSQSSSCLRVAGSVISVYYFRGIWHTYPVPCLSFRVRVWPAVPPMP
jgi:hypothetical protein